MLGKACGVQHTCPTRSVLSAICAAYHMLPAANRKVQGQCFQSCSKRDLLLYRDTNCQNFPTVLQNECLGEMMTVPGLEGVRMARAKPVDRLWARVSGPCKAVHKAHLSSEN